MSRVLLPFALGISLAAAGLAACSSTSTTEVAGDDDGGPRSEAGAPRDGSAYDSTPSPESGLGEILFRPNAVYSGVDGTHTFKSPIAVYDAASDLKVTASDPAVTITKVALASPVLPDGTSDNGSYFMVTSTKEGTFTLTAASQGRTTTATLTVTSYAPTRWAVGETRYTKGGTTDPPCTNCHVNGSAIDHSPAAMSSADDEALAAVITSGIKPNNTPVMGVQGGHKWKVSPTERDGLVTYLRALDPKGFK